MNNLSIKYLTVRKSKIALLSLMVIFAVVSCQKKGEDIASGSASVSLNISEISFEKVNKIDYGNKSTSNNVLISNSDMVQTRTVKLNDDYYLTAELRPELQVVSANSKLGHKAAMESSNMVKGIKYNVIVYNDAGIYVSEKEYTRGSESLSSNFLLDGGKTYTFIIYSINSSTKLLPKVKFGNSNKTLATSEITVDGSSDFLYAKIEKKVVGGAATNKIDVTLKHQFSEITVTVDATATGSNITELSNVTVKPHNKTSIINISNGNNIRTGEMIMELKDTLSAMKQQIFMSKPFIINSAANSTGSFDIGRISLDGLTRKKIPTLSNFSIVPGTKYNLNIKLNLSKDAIITINNVPSVVIAGQTWMRHNLGAQTSANADTDRSVRIHGRYYQWGYDYQVANPADIKPKLTDQEWKPTAMELGIYLGWYNYRELQGKRPSDPCPNGFRLPFVKEFQKLIDNTNHSNIGTFIEDYTSYSAAKVLTSKTNTNIKLTFPMQGWVRGQKVDVQGVFPPLDAPEPFPFGEVTLRGIVAFLYTGSVELKDEDQNKPTFNIVIMDEGQVRIMRGTPPRVNFNRVVAANVRCISE